MEKMMNSVAYLQGNARQFTLDKVVANPASPLAGKTIAFLGSSVTAGFAAKGKSFVDYLITRDGVRAVKLAVSGTTLAGQEPGGYLARLYHDFPGNIQYDLFTSYQLMITTMVSN